MPIDANISDLISNRIRVRICGLLQIEEGLVLANHKGLYGYDFWLPPGGGLEFGENAESCLIREFQEECGLHVEPGPFMFACSVINKTLHAVELFFSVKQIGGEIMTGIDPERGSAQIISEVKTLPFRDLDLMDRQFLHPLFRQFAKTKEIMTLNGFFEVT
jgi:8-oxo-dGTP diphosphatase